MGRSVFSIYCKVKMLRKRSFSIEILIVIVAFGSTNGMKWWKSTLAETTEIVKEIQGSLSFSNCNGNETEPCAGPGYELYIYTYDYEYYDYDYCDTYYEVYDPSSSYYLLYGYDYDCNGDIVWSVWDMPGSDWIDLEDGCVEATEVSGYIRGNRKDAKNEVPSKKDRNAKKRP